MKKTIVLITSCLLLIGFTVSAQITYHLDVEGDSKIDGRLHINKGNNNVLIGSDAGVNNTGSYNVFLGNRTGENNIASNQVFVGNSAGLNNTTGFSNTFIGQSSGGNNTVGHENAFFGYRSGLGNIDGIRNVFMGFESGLDNVNGDANTFIGYKAQSSNPNSERAIAIGTGAVVDCNNCAVIGGTGTGAVNLGIATSNPSHRLHVENNNSNQNTIYGEYTGSTSDIPAIYGKNESADNFGVGVQGVGGYRGVIGIGNANASGDPIGVFGLASGGTTGTRYGVYGEAYAGSDASSRAYAVFALGDMKATSQLFIGTDATMEDATSDYELVVNGEAIVEELVVELSDNWPDYVFEEEYDLKPLSEVQSFINKNGHLPNVPSAATLEAGDGIAVGEMQLIMMEKIEELTLYTINQEERMKNLEAKNEILMKEIEALKK